MGRRSPKATALATVAEGAALAQAQLGRVKLPDLVAVAAAAPAKPIRLDLGAGTDKREGFIAVDKGPFDGVVKVDLAHDVWPWADNSVDEAIASHIFEHFTPDERRHFMNEMHRVMKPTPVGKVDPKVLMVTPHWASMRAYGDPTHVWPPVCEMSYWYHNAEWRKVNAPHLVGYTSNFEVMQPTYSLHSALVTRAQEFQQHQLAWAKEAAQDMMCVLLKREAPPAT